MLAKAADRQTFKSTFIHRKIAGRENNDALEQRLASPSALNTSLSIIGLPEIAQLKKQLCRSQHNIVYPFWELEKLGIKLLVATGVYDVATGPLSSSVECDRTTLPLLLEVDTCVMLVIFKAVFVNRQT